MATTKKATTSKTTTVAAAFPAKTAATPAAPTGTKHFRTRKPKDALADQTTAKKAAAKPAAPKAPAKPRSAAAKRAEPTGTKKVASKAAKPATAPAKPAKGAPSKHVVKNIAGLIKFLSTMPSGGHFDAERMFGVPTLLVKNIRGRVIAEVAQLGKVAK